MEKMANNSKMMIMIIAAVVAIGGVAFALNNKDSDSNANTSDVMEKKDGEDVMEKKDGEVMEKADEVMEKEDGEVMEKHGDSMEKEDDVMEKEDSAMEKTGSFVTLENFNSNKSSYSDSDKILFFHASWCSICKGIEEEIENNPNKIPNDAVVIKVDYDSETALRQKHGVTTQYTFVQIDNNGDQIAKWSATSLDAAIDGIQ